MVQPAEQQHRHFPVKIAKNLGFYSKFSASHCLSTDYIVACLHSLFLSPTLAKLCIFYPLWGRENPLHVYSMQCSAFFHLFATAHSQPTEQNRPNCMVRRYSEPAAGAAARPSLVDNHSFGQRNGGRGRWMMGRWG